MTTEQATALLESIEQATAVQQLSLLPALRVRLSALEKAHPHYTFKNGWRDK